MFNRVKVKNLEQAVYNLKDRIETRDQIIKELRDRLIRFEEAARSVFNVLGRHHFEYLVPLETKLQNYADELKEEAKKQAERGRIEAIIRDLLKANVFKQV